MVPFWDCLIGFQNMNPEKELLWGLRVLFTMFRLLRFWGLVVGRMQCVQLGLSLLNMLWLLC